MDLVFLHLLLTPFHLVVGSKELCIKSQLSFLMFLLIEKIGYDFCLLITTHCYRTSLLIYIEAAIRGVLGKFAKFLGKHLYQSFFFRKVAGLRSQACNFIKKETLALSKNTFFTEHLWATASIMYSKLTEFKSFWAICVWFLF